MLQLRCLPNATTELLLVDVAAECQISKSGLRYTFDLGRRQGHGMPAPRHALRPAMRKG
ncbi:class I SAM-dependent methyltransferase [Pseudomonas stutzeri]|uniref:class I SAM-dependent methyltransferase n=1 Tax=Stutzerimonas stutzeri TaxID=316 RepID=UPI0015E14A50